MIDNDLPLLMYQKKVYELLGIGHSKFHELKKMDGFPKPVNIDGKTPIYRSADILGWVKQLEKIKDENV